VDYATAQGYGPQISSVKRSIWKQAELYRAYLSNRTMLPAAAPGRSAHNYGWAFDVVLGLDDPAAYEDLGAVWEAWGGTWGGRRDPVHFEFAGASRYLRTVPRAELYAWWSLLEPASWGSSLGSLFGL
jgi:hypothetical protein